MCGKAKISHLTYCCPARSTFPTWNMNRMTNYLLFAQGNTKYPVLHTFNYQENLQRLSYRECWLWAEFPAQVPLGNSLGTVGNPCQGGSCFLTCSPEWEAVLALCRASTELSQVGKGQPGNTAWPLSGAQTPIWWLCLMHNFPSGPRRGTLPGPGLLLLAWGRTQVRKEQGIQLGKFATLRLKQN